MQVHTCQRARILCIAALIFLAGCSNSPTTSDKGNDQGPPAPNLVTNMPITESVTGSEQKDKVQHVPVGVVAPLPVAPLAMTRGRALAKMQAAPASLRAQGQGMAAPMVMREKISDGAACRLGPPSTDRESYNAQGENPVVATANDPLSTFSIDVDTASYSNVRRLLTAGTLPPPGAVRIEEMINYFSYSYPEPGDGPIAIATELGPCPWRPENQLIRIGLKAKDLRPETIPPSNLVFLVDVSGSMNEANNLPLLQQSMSMLVDQMTGRDRIAIVAYAGADRVVLPPTAGDKTTEIKAAISSLTAGGSTHASGGIKTAYNLARQSFMPPITALSSPRTATSMSASPAATNSNG